jgi:hypothetical protein
VENAPQSDLVPVPGLPTPTLGGHETLLADFARKYIW